MEHQPSFPTTFRIIHLEGNIKYDQSFDTSKAVSIGRDASVCDIVVPATENCFSRLHCKLYSLGRDVVVQDHSANGTYVNGKKLEKGNPKRVTSGDTIALAMPTSSVGQRFTWVFFSSFDGGIDEATGQVDWRFFHNNKQSRAVAANDLASCHPNLLQRSNSAQPQETTTHAEGNHNSRVPVFGQQQQHQQQTATAQNLREGELHESKTSHAKAGDVVAGDSSDSSNNAHNGVSRDCLPRTTTIITTIVKPFHQNSRILKHYAIGDVLGTGNFATVREGWPLNDPTKKVAVKIVEKKRFSLVTGGSDMQFDMLLNESSVLRTMSHENIVKVYDVFDEPECFAMVMEYVRCGDLFDLLVARSNLQNHLSAAGHPPPPPQQHNHQPHQHQQQEQSTVAAASSRCGLPFDEKEAKALFVQLLEAVVYMHTQGVVHRDLKIENVLVDVADEIYDKFDPSLSNEAKRMILPLDKVTLKVTDFGLAKFCKYGEKLSTFCGTPNYVAPEITMVQLIKQIQNRVAALKRQQLQEQLDRETGLDFGDDNNNNNNRGRNAKNRQQQQQQQQDSDFGIVALDKNTEIQHLENELAIQQQKQERGGYSKAVDIYSLGAILFVLLFGQLPQFDHVSERVGCGSGGGGGDGGGGNVIITKKVVRFPVDARTGEVLGRVSAQARNLVERMLKEDPDERITLGGILAFPWLKDVVIQGRQRYKDSAAEKTAFEQTVQQQHQTNDYDGNPGTTMLMVMPGTASDIETLDRHLLATSSPPPPATGKSNKQIFGGSSFVGLSQQSSSSSSSTFQSQQQQQQQIFSLDDAMNNKITVKLQQQQQQQQQTNNVARSQDVDDADEEDDMFIDLSELRSRPNQNEKHDQQQLQHQQREETTEPKQASPISYFYAQQQLLQVEKAKLHLGNASAKVRMTDRSGTATLDENSSHSSSLSQSSSPPKTKKNYYDATATSSDRADTGLSSASFFSCVLSQDGIAAEESPPTNEEHDDPENNSDDVDTQELMAMTMNSFQQQQQPQQHRSTVTSSATSPRSARKLQKDSSVFLSDSKETTQQRKQKTNNNKENNSDTDVDQADDSDSDTEAQRQQHERQEGRYDDDDEASEESRELAKRLGNPQKVTKTESNGAGGLGGAASFAVPNDEDAILVSTKSPGKNSGQKNGSSSSASSSPYHCHHHHDGSRAVAPLSLSSSSTATVSSGGGQRRKTVQWQWKSDLDKKNDDDTAWQPYTDGASEFIEERYRAGQRQSCKVPGLSKVQICLTRDENGLFFQFRKDDITRQRHVRRVEF